MLKAPTAVLLSGSVLHYAPIRAIAARGSVPRTPHRGQRWQLVSASLQPAVSLDGSVFRCDTDRAEGSLLSARHCLFLDKCCY